MNLNVYIDAMNSTKFVQKYLNCHLYTNNFSAQCLKMATESQAKTASLDQKWQQLKWISL